MPQFLVQVPNIWLRGGPLLILMVLFAACSGIQGSTVTTEEKEGSPHRVPIGREIWFDAQDGLQKESSLSYSVVSGADMVKGTLNFRTISNFSPTHLLALLNFSPIDAFKKDKTEEKLSSVVVNPLSEKTVAIPLEIPTHILQPGLNCLIFTAQEEPEQRLSSRQQTQQISYRFDIYNGQEEASFEGGCPILGEPNVRAKIRPRKMGTPLSWISVEPERTRNRQRIAWTDLDEGRVFVTVAGFDDFGNQQGAVWIVADGQPLMVDGKPLFSIFELAEGEEAHIIFPLPRPQKGMAITAVHAPLVDRSIHSLALGRTSLQAMPKTSWQVVVVP